MRQHIEPINYTIDGAIKASGMSRTRLYELMGCGRVSAVKAGRQTLITADSLRSYLASLPPATIRQVSKAA